ncbi:2,3,4,5-tetrahydropyridine-2,6-dicarboxylate N-succinyltransferase [Nocardia thailandica]|uniref:2,3,4,5-tetrahydropyridine-2,6-dicarboxylate N-succinyltransferase n=1 Tax=Nocardia thailandica TaxID=257275 RepID=UPI0002E30A44|nr:2,3,4,5-tetrahydropyridine-2,6-dicarboxylate N-succinyltransferase [Nocardia thailandica]
MTEQTLIDEWFARRDTLTADDIAALSGLVEDGLAQLDCGKLRAAAPVDGGWVVDTAVNKLILLSFRTRTNRVVDSGGGLAPAFDKMPLKFENWGAADFEAARLRVVPGAVVRHGAYVGPGAVLMPCFVNIGAYIGADTMIDTWATVGSCAQVGSRCHISGGAGLGGVLEPVGEQPVIIEDDVFVGARSEIAEGVRVRRGAVIGMGVFLSRSTPILDRTTGDIHYGEVPENAVVIAGGRTDAGGPAHSLYSAIIVKYADARTRGKTALNALARD